MRLTGCWPTSRRTDNRHLTGPTPAQHNTMEMTMNRHHKMLAMMVSYLRAMLENAEHALKRGNDYTGLCDVQADAESMARDLREFFGEEED